MLVEHFHLYLSGSSGLHYSFVLAPIETFVTFISRSCLKSSTVVSELGSATSASKSVLVAYTLPVLLCLIISFASAGILGKSLINFSYYFCLRPCLLYFLLFCNFFFLLGLFECLPGLFLGLSLSTKSLNFLAILIFS